MQLTLNPCIHDRVLGATGTGKTTFVNSVSGGHLPVGDGLWSCTNTIQVSPSFTLHGRRVTLIDTPGFDDTAVSDTDILNMISVSLAEMYKSNFKLTGIIYLHRISDVRMGGVSTRNFKMFRKLCGEETLRNVVIITNMWGLVAPELGEARERELMTDENFFKPVLDRGAQMVRHDNTTRNAQAILLHLINNIPLPLRIQIELVDLKKNLAETDAGADLNRVILELMEKHQRELKQVRLEVEGTHSTNELENIKPMFGDLTEAIRDHDEQTRGEMEAERAKLQAKIDLLQSEARIIASDYATQKALLQKKMEEDRRMAAEEMERLSNIISALRLGFEKSTAELDDLKKKYKEAKQRFDNASRNCCIVM
ncbi:hypothetical protein V5O48_018070 [Marasmius crinis-equi]|uniref:G domain-containing protein n=1 Tax=Marasmius crinis-equi TaxID=585013 RepID=A0ABR3EMB7_9AGAR